jgi:WD40 repeat protein
MAGHEAAIWMVARSPDGHTLATASDDHTARLWPSENPGESITLRGHDMPVWSVSFDATGARVVTASFDGTARVWSTTDGSLLFTLRGHAETLWSGEFVDEHRIVTSSDDNTIRVWSLLPGVPTIELSGHADGVTNIAIAPDRKRMYSASADRTAKIWHMDLLNADAEHLRARLGVITRFCLSAEQRVRELGEDLGQAQLAGQRCELAYGGSGL